MIMGRSPLLFDDCGGLEEGGDRDEYGSESDGMVSWEADKSGGDGDCSRSLRVVIVRRAGRGNSWCSTIEVRRLPLGVGTMHPCPVETELADEGDWTCFSL